MSEPNEMPPSVAKIAARHALRFEPLELTNNALRDIACQENIAYWKTHHSRYYLWLTVLFTLLLFVAAVVWLFKDQHLLASLVLLGVIVMTYIIRWMIDRRSRKREGYIGPFSKKMYDYSAEQVVEYLRKAVSAPRPGGPSAHLLSVVKEMHKHHPDSSLFELYFVERRNQTGPPDHGPLRAMAVWSDSQHFFFYNDLRVHEERDRYARAVNSVKV